MRALPLGTLGTGDQLRTGGVLMLGDGVAQSMGTLQTTIWGLNFFSLTGPFPAGKGIFPNPPWILAGLHKSELLMLVSKDPGEPREGSEFSWAP